MVFSGEQYLFVGSGNMISLPEECAHDVWEA